MKGNACPSLIKTKVTKYYSELKLLLILGHVEVVIWMENVRVFDKFEKIFEDHRYFGVLPRDIFTNHEEITACDYLMTRN